MDKDLFKRTAVTLIDLFMCSTAPKIHFTHQKVYRCPTGGTGEHCVN